MDTSELEQAESSSGRAWHYTLGITGTVMLIIAGIVLWYSYVHHPAPPAPKKADSSDEVQAVLLEPAGTSTPVASAVAVDGTLNKLAKKKPVASSTPEIEATLNQRAATR